MLDTNTCIRLIKHDPETLASFSEKKDEGVAISTIVLAELEFGVCNSAAYEKNRAKLISLLSLVDLLSFDGAAAIAYGSICTDLRKKRNPIGHMDMLIAAHAKSKNLVVVSNNLREFERVENLTVEDWSAVS